MDVVSVSQLRAASLVWQPRRDAFALTVVCKATYVLAPVTAELAPAQEYPNEDENHWNDDPARSLYAPSDLAPMKPRAEVMLVGHAFAPRGERARAVVARLIVGEIDKAVEVVADRSFALDGTLREGAPFTRVPLRYERAAGGPDTANPVGVRPDARDAYGALSLPNLQPPGLVIASPSDYIAPVGFGPIACDWGPRREKLGALAGRWHPRALASEPMPEPFDPSYFMAAPRDQQLAALRPDERVVLEHLHADHPRLVTSLPGIEPRAFVERPGAPPQELKLVPDTLWIDTDRSLSTLTWRGQLQIEHPAAPGRVLVGAARVGWPLSWADVDGVEGEHRRARAGQRPASPSMHPVELLQDEEGPTPPPVQGDDAQRRASLPLPANAGSLPNKRSGLPFHDPASVGKKAEAATATPGEDVSRPRSNTVTMLHGGHTLKGPSLGETIDTVLANNVVERAVAAAAADRAQRFAPPAPAQPSEATTPAPGDASPAWLRAPRPAPSQPQSPAPQRIGFGPPPPVPVPAPALSAPQAPPLVPQDASPVWLTTGPDALSAPAPIAPTVGQQAAAPAPIAPTVGQQAAQQANPGTTGTAPTAPLTVGSTPGSPARPGLPRPAVVRGDAAKLGAAAASDAAAANDGAASAASPAPGADGAAARAQARPREILDLLWFQPDLGGRLRAAAPFQPLFPQRTVSDAWITGDLPARDGQADQAARDRRDVLRVLGFAEPLDAARFERAIDDACDEEGAFAPPLAVAAGELTFRFDEREALKATVTSVAPFIGGDKKLRDVVAEATEALKGEWPLPDDVAEGFTRRVEQAFAQSVRSVPPGYLQSSVDKLLLEGRHYRKKSVFSEARIRAELTGSSSRELAGGGTGEPLPTYLPVALAMRLPLFSRFRSVMIVELRVQEDQHEAHPQALLAMAVARVIDRRRVEKPST